MGKQRDLTKEEITSIISLYKEKSVKDIARIVCFVLAWTKKFKDGGGSVPP